MHYGTHRHTHAHIFSEGNHTHHLDYKPKVPRPGLLSFIIPSPAPVTATVDFLPILENSFYSQECLCKS